MKHTPFKSLPLLLSLSLLLGAFANVSALNYADGRTWYCSSAVGVPCTSKNASPRQVQREKCPSLDLGYGAGRGLWRP